MAELATPPAGGDNSHSLSQTTGAVDVIRGGQTGQALADCVHHQCQADGIRREGPVCLRRSPGALPNAEFVRRLKELLRARLVEVYIRACPGQAAP